MQEREIFELNFRGKMQDSVCFCVLFACSCSSINNQNRGGPGPTALLSNDGDLICFTMENLPELVTVLEKNKNPIEYGFLKYFSNYHLGSLWFHKYK